MNSLFRFFSPLAFLCLLPSLLLAQLPPLQPEQDCINALPICQLVIPFDSSYVGEGLNPDEIDPSPSCLNSGERNNVWFRIEPVDSGMICFDIIPNNINYDYDWAVYDLSSHLCSDIYSTPSLEISCNYSGIWGITGPNGAFGPQNEPCIPVAGGEDLVIIVTNFSGNGEGFTLDFTASTTQLIDSTLDSLTVLIDTVSNLPTLNGLLVQMNTPVLCAQQFYVPK